MVDFTNILSGAFCTVGVLKVDIYIIKNKANGCVYVGQSRLASLRWGQHKKDLRKGNHVSKSMQKDWDIYGEDFFEFSILERVFKNYANKYEAMWIQAYAGSKCYNHTHNKEKK